jgi:hypothetical protein
MIHPTISEPVQFEIKKRKIQSVLIGIRELGKGFVVVGKTCKSKQM